MSLASGVRVRAQSVLPGSQGLLVLPKLPINLKQALLVYHTLNTSIVCTPNSSFVSSTSHDQSIKNATGSLLPPTTLDNMKQFLFTIIATLLALTVLAAPTPAGASVDQSAGYPLRCNGNNLSEEARRTIIDWIGSGLANWLETDEIKVGRRGFNINCPFTPRACARVSLRIWPGDAGQDSATARITNIKKGVDRLNNECGSKGGSVGVPDEPDVVVHMNKDYA